MQAQLNNYEQFSISISGATFNYDNVILSKPTSGKSGARRPSHDPIRLKFVSLHRKRRDKRRDRHDFPDLCAMQPRLDNSLKYRPR